LGAAATSEINNSSKNEAMMIRRKQGIEEQEYGKGDLQLIPLYTHPLPIIHATISGRLARSAAHRTLADIPDSISRKSNETK
jgi:hypothetical protein